MKKHLAKGFNKLIKISHAGDSSAPSWRPDSCISDWFCVDFRALAASGWGRNVAPLVSYVKWYQYYRLSDTELYVLKENNLQLDWSVTFLMQRYGYEPCRYSSSCLYHWVCAMNAKILYDIVSWSWKLILFHGKWFIFSCQNCKYVEGENLKPYQVLKEFTFWVFILIWAMHYIYLIIQLILKPFEKEDSSQKSFFSPHPSTISGGLQGHKHTKGVLEDLLLAQKLEGLGFFCSSFSSFS